MAKVIGEYWINTYNEYYACWILSRSITSQKLEADSYHLSGKSNSDVKRLIFNACIFDEFPRNLHEVFPNLCYLWIWNCKLDSISREDIGGLRGVRQLHIRNCGLKCLQGDLFRDLKQLEAVSFHGNKLSEIEPDILDDLQHLTFANFRGNATIDMMFNSSDSESISLDALKEEIKLKCKPKELQPVECEFSVGLSGEYRCQVSAQAIIRLQLKFNGKHKGGRSASDVDELFFENCTFAVFPRNLHELFPNLSTIQMQNCTLNKVNCKEINEIMNFCEFNLQNCNVKGEFLGDMKQFTSVLLPSNRMKKIELETEKLKKISNILCDKAFKDFTINVENASFKIHKLFFAAHSVTLAEIFKNNPEAVELNLQDVPEATFKVIYDFIYSEKLPETFNNWTELFVAANRLKIDDLAQIAANKLENNITDENAQGVLELANKLNNDKLRERAFEHLTKKYFPNKTIKKELSKEPERMKALIVAKLKLDREHEEVMKKMQKLEVEIS